MKKKLNKKTIIFSHKKIKKNKKNKTKKPKKQTLIN